MASVFKTRQLLHESESTFNEYAESGTPTWTRAIAYNDCTVELMDDLEADAGSQPYIDDIAPGHQGVRRAKLTFTQYLWGHGSAPTGSTTEHAQALLIGRGLGSAVTNYAGTTISAASSASSFSITTAGNWAAGVVGRVGSKNDTRGDGQAFVIGSISGTTITSINALPATPSASDVVYATLLQHWDSSDGATPTGTERFMVMHSESGQQYALTGCQMSGLEYDYKINSGFCEVKSTYEAAYYRRVTRTFPDALAPPDQYAFPVAGGSLVIQSVGTTTRAVYNPSEVKVTLNIGIEPVLGSSTASRCNINAWKRTAADATIAVTVPASDASTLEGIWDQTPDSYTYRYILWNCTGSAGYNAGCFAPRVLAADKRPNEIVNVNGQNYVTAVFRCRRGATTTNDLTVSPIRFWQG